jgi:hypothetical protein
MNVAVTRAAEGFPRRAFTTLPGFSFRLDEIG